MKVIESNIQTGQVTERDMTPEEIESVMASQPPKEEVIEAVMEAVIEVKPEDV
jgi:hypothetical protein